MNVLNKIKDKVSTKEGTSAKQEAQAVTNAIAESYEAPTKKGNELTPKSIVYIDAKKESGSASAAWTEMKRKKRLREAQKNSWEIQQITKLRTIWEGCLGNTVIDTPIQFKYESKHSLDGSMFVGLKDLTSGLLSYNEGFQPDSEYFLTTNWYRRIDVANGLFRPEAKTIINIICAFQYQKNFEQGIQFRGYPDDPENLFLEELKSWVTKEFANYTEKDKDNIIKRCGYLEEILCKYGLFDDPYVRDKNTVQRVIVEVRRVMRATIQIIDANRAHEDAGRSLDEIMESLRLLLDEALTLLWYSYRNENTIEMKERGPTDKASALHYAVLESKCIKPVLPHRAIAGKPARSIVLAYEDGAIKLHPDFLKKDPNVKSFPLAETEALVNVPKDSMVEIFAGTNAGFDPNFLKNSFATQFYLESYSYVLELGNLYQVFKKAKGLAQTGGTLLLYGVANAQFNALMELCERNVDSLRTAITNVVHIAEARFEKLVLTNGAATSRCKWIGNYRELPRTLVQVEKNSAELFKKIAKAKSEANSLSLKDRKDNAERETNDFLSLAQAVTSGKKGQLYALEQSEKQTAAANNAAKAANEITDSIKAQVDTQSSSTFEYVFTVDTAPIMGNGTDCDILITIFGADNSLVTTLADDTGKKFNAGSKDTFQLIVTKSLGEINGISLKLLPSAKSKDILRPSGVDDWKIAKIELFDAGCFDTYYFPTAEDAELNKSKQELFFPGTKTMLEKS